MRNVLVCVLSLFSFFFVSFIPQQQRARNIYVYVYLVRFSKIIICICRYIYTHTGDRINKFILATKSHHQLHYFKIESQIFVVLFLIHAMGG